MKITVKDKDGKDVEIDTAALAGVSLDALSTIPAIAALKAQVPAEGAKIVNASEFEALNAKVVELSGALATVNETAKAQAKRALEAEKAVRQDRLVGLKRTGRIDGTDEAYGRSLLELEGHGPAMFDAWHTVMAAKPAKVELAGALGSGGEGEGTVEKPHKAFMSLIEAECAKDPKESYLTVIRRVELEHPALARAAREDSSLKGDYRDAPTIQNVVDRVNVVRN